MNPLISFEHLVLFMALLAIGAGVCAWKTSCKAQRRDRCIMVACRVLAVVLLAVVAANPGEWRRNLTKVEREWAIMIDRSLSMAVDDIEGSTRWDEAMRVVDEAMAASEGRVKSVLYTFSGSLEGGIQDASEPLLPDGETTDIFQSGRDLLARYRTGGKTLNGIVLLSDGRQVKDSVHDDLALMARSQEAAIYPIVLGGEVVRKDIAVSPGRRQYVAFAGQKARISAIVSAAGLGKVKVAVGLYDSAGSKIDERRVDLADGQAQDVNFHITAGEKGYYEYEFRVLPWAEESTENNNAARTGIAVLGESMNVLLTEGVPFWDTKFLTQLLRKQPHTDVTSVYRLSSDRFFKVETDASEASDSASSIFPDSKENLATYDVVVFGKGVEYFLTAERINLLRSYVRDQGGCVIFSRGKPYSGSFSELEFLEPVEWGGLLNKKFSFQPTQAGEDVGLFGDLLPSPEDKVWKSLPDLQYAYRCPGMKAFSQVLAEGTFEAGGKKRTVPMIVSRRYGKGIVVVVNGEGLWQWDFFSSVPEASRMYKELWMMLIQWTASYSEYLPGQEYSLKLGETTVLPETPVRARISYRGRGTVTNAPLMNIVRRGDVIRQLSAVKAEKEDNRWDAIFALKEPGAYRVELAEADDIQGRSPCAALFVRPGKNEKDELSADPAFLERLASESGGRIISESDIEKLLNDVDPESNSEDAGKAIWAPHWDRLWLLMLIAVSFAAEWFFRRRNGLL